MKGLGKSLGRAGAILAQAIVLACLALPSPAAAQTTTYVNSTDGAVGESTTCTNPLVRNFSVGPNFTVSDVDIGINVQHTMRGGLRMTLQSPAGTRVQIVDGNDNAISADNFNVRLNDQASQLVNTDGNNNHSTASSPPFQHNFIPSNGLSAFAGEASSGTWRLEVCNIGFWQQILWWTFYTGGTGTFTHAELYLTQAPAAYADLSLSKSVGGGGSGGSVEYVLTVANASSSPSSATGVTVTDVLPAGVSYSSHSGGTYNPATGVWAVGTLAPGESQTLSIIATVTASNGTPITNVAEISASSAVDLDSTPNNGATGEDDYDSATFVAGSRLAGIPPNLMCPKSTILFDWDTRAWTAGSTSASYAVTGLGTVAFAITNPGQWLDLFDGDSPTRTNDVTGGLIPAQYSLVQAVNMGSRNQVVSTTITLPLAVDGVQFSLFDVDFGNNQFADRVKVTGSYGGAPVVPVLTNGVANYVSGNEAFGDGTADNDEGNGNVVVTFQSAVDTIVIEYGNHSAAPSDPGQQAITIHDITFCEPHADIAVSKTSTVIDNPTQGTTNPTAIPGATLSYCILVTNAGSAPATSVSAIDPIPANVTFVAGSMQSGASCAATSTTEDDNAAGGDDSDAIGASFAGNQVLVTTDTLGPSESIALRFRATVN